MALFEDSATGKIYSVDSEGRRTEVNRAALETTQLERIGIGAGRILDEGIRGAQNIFANAVGNDALARRLAEESAENNRLYGGLSAAFPVSTGIGEILPALATIPLGGGLLTQAAIGTAIGGIQYDADPSQQGLNALTEGALSGVGYGVGNLAGRVINGITRAGRVTTATPEAQRLIDAGGVVTPGQRAGSTGLRQFEASIEKFPGGGTFFQGLRDTNIKNANRVVGKAIGATDEVMANSGGKISDEVLQQADDQLADFYSRFSAGGQPMRLSDDMTERLLRNPEIKELQRLGALENLENGVIESGRDILAVRKTLTGLIGDATGKKSGQFEFLQEMLNNFDQQISRNLGPQELQALNKANEQYRNLSIIQKGSVISPDGDISIPKLRTQLKTGFGKTFTQSRTGLVDPATADLIELSKAGSSGAVRSIIGDSGTGGALATSQAVGDVAQGVVNRDAGQVARGVAVPALGSAYGILAEKMPGLLGGLLEQRAGNIAERTGSRFGGLLPEYFDQGQ